MSVEENTFRQIISYFVDSNDIIDKMIKQQTASFWKHNITLYIEQQIEQEIHKNIGIIYGIEKKNDSDEKYLLKMKTIEYLLTKYEIKTIETRVKPPSTKGRLVRSGSRYEAKAHSAPLIDLYLRTGDNQRIWVDVLTDLRKLNEIWEKADNYSRDFDLHYMVFHRQKSRGYMTLNAYDIGHILVYDEKEDRVKEYKSFQI